MKTLRLINRFAQMGKHLVGDQLSPMSVSGAKRHWNFRQAHTTQDVMKTDQRSDVLYATAGFWPDPNYASIALAKPSWFSVKETVVPERKSFDGLCPLQRRTEARGIIWEHSSGIRTSDGGCH